MCPFLSDLRQSAQRGNCTFAWPAAAFLLVFFASCPLRAAESPNRPPPQSAPAPVAAQADSAQTQAPVTEYTLPPKQYRDARHLAQISFWTQIIGFLYSVGLLLLILGTRLGPHLRDVAERTARSRLVQAMIFGPAIFALLALAGIPLDIADHWMGRRFGLSVQGWGSWLGDWTKEQLLSILLGTFLVAILYAVMRASPRRWWFYFWLVTFPLTVTLVFLQPLLIDPLFHRFEPLNQTDPALAQALEGMVHRAGQDIPVERMFWMSASDKTKELNAYVTGVGASKRIVVWDTTIAALTTPQIVIVASHEMGHYVLNHIWKGMAVSFAGLFIAFYLAYRLIAWLLTRRGDTWGIRAVDDWASLPALILLLTVIGFLANPVANGFSRYVEHQADQYGLEVAHGLVANSPQVAAQMFQVLGQIDLSDPAPNRLDIFLFYSHPAIPDRVRFALTYQPWVNGGHGEFIP
jgi:STE24 endopeptidase